MLICEYKYNKYIEQLVTGNPKIGNTVIAFFVMLGELSLLYLAQLLYSKNNMVSDMNAMFLFTPDGT